MPSFTIQVPLHDGDADDYENFHSCMKIGKFSRTVSSDNGDYNLPEAEFNMIGNFTKNKC